VAKVIGITEAQISRIERGQTGLHLSTLELYLSAVNAALVVVDPAVDPRASFAACTPAQQALLLRLAKILPSLPDTLFDNLSDQIRALEARYGGEDL
jgi:transcriptional regulator with XRE-family HTH domain